MIAVVVGLALRPIILDVFSGEMSLLTGEARTATIRATTAGAAYRIGREAISPVIEADPALILKRKMNHG